MKHAVSKQTGHAGFNRTLLTRFANSYLGCPGAVELRVKPLSGGLEACGIARVIACGSTDTGRKKTASFVVKQLEGAGLREVEIYRELLAGDARGIAPRLLGTEKLDRNSRYAYLEWVSGTAKWPWNDSTSAASVLRQLARVHSHSAPRLTALLRRWDYHGELQASAQATVEFLATMISSGERPGNRAMLRMLQRITSALPQMQKELLAAHGATVLHGDAHTGNAIVRSVKGRREVVLLDWGRARIGSPLEDVSSWLQSLGYWEPDARRDHDKLLKEYLIARGMNPRLGRDLRDLYWLAGACNAVAGALQYHLKVMHDPARSPRERFEANRAAADWLRIIRRADACWRA